MARLIIVEDESLVATDLEELLLGLGHHICGVYDSAEGALQGLAHEKPELALLDIHLRGPQDGIALGAQLLQAGVGCIYLTALSDGPTLERAAQTEPLGYLTKPVRSEDLKAALTTALQRHRADQQLRKMERWLSTTLQSLGEGVIATDEQGLITFLNPMAESLTGWKFAEAIGRHHAEVFQFVDGSGDEGSQGHQILSRSGEVIAVDPTLSPIREGEHRLGTVIVFRDARRRRALEQKRLELERQVQQSQRLESLGVMAAGIAHDFNNLVAIIQGNLELCVEGRSRTSQESWEQIQDAMARARELCSQMLSYVGEGPLERQPVELAELTRAHLAVVAAVHPGVHFQVLQIPPGEPLWVLGDRRQLGQVWLNLLDNAAESMLGQGSVRVELEANGSRALLRIIDQGKGITPEQRSRILEPFFSTKPQGRGMGLTAALGVVRRHGGTLEFESTPGQGSCFTVSLPGVPVPAPHSAEVRSLSGLRVLVADDEDGMRRLMSLALKRLGLQVVEARDGEQALQLLREQQNSLELAVMDVRMPKLSGAEVVRQARLFLPHLPVLLVSGFHEEQLDAESADFLAKPFSIEALQQRAREMLGACG